MTTLLKLKQKVDAWLVRNDVAVTGADFPEILLIAESDIARDVRCVVQEVVTTLNFTGRSADLPADFLEARNPFVDSPTRKISYMTPQAIRESTAWVNGRVGAFYTLEGGDQTAGDERVQMTIAGPASAGSPLSLDVRYWKRFPALSGNNDTNWLLKNHFDLYLYAALRAAAEYIQEDALEDRFAGKYDVRVAKLALHENRKRYGAMPKVAHGSPRSVV